MTELCAYHTRNGIAVVDILDDNAMEMFFFIYPEAEPVIHFDTLYEDYFLTHNL